MRSAGRHCSSVSSFVSGTVAFVFWFVSVGSVVLFWVVCLLPLHEVRLAELERDRLARFMLVGVRVIHEPLMRMDRTPII